MKEKFEKAIDSKIEDDAEALLKEAIREFAISLLLDAKLNAYSQGYKTVSGPHVKGGQAILKRMQKPRKRKQIMIAVGGILLGAFFNGFVDAAFAEPVNIIQIVVYVMAGLIGVALSVWGLVDTKEE